MNVEEIIKQLINELIGISKSKSIHWNERYLHHRFSYLIQSKTDYKVHLSNEGSTFHPEWATAIKKNDDNDGNQFKEGGVYALGEDGFYEPRENFDSGHAAWIDFALGDYMNPNYAVEFKMAEGMNTKGFAFDYMKLLDNRNTIKKVISLSVVYNRKMPLDKCNNKTNANPLQKSLEAVVSKLKVDENNKECCFYVIQIYKGREPRMWKCDSLEKGFIEEKLKQEGNTWLYE